MDDDYVHLHRDGRPPHVKLEDIPVWEQFIQEHPNSATGYAAKANILRDYGYYEDAIAGYEKALSLAPRDANYHYLVGMLYFICYFNRKALAHFEKALEICPSFYMAQFGVQNCRSELNRS